MYPDKIKSIKQAAAAGGITCMMTIGILAIVDNQPCMGLSSCVIIPSRNTAGTLNVRDKQPNGNINAVRRAECTNYAALAARILCLLSFGGKHLHRQQL